MKTESEERKGLAWNDVAQIPSIARIFDQSKNFEQRIISIYKWVRDMPFEVKLETGDYYKNSAYIKTHKRGSCSQKHYLLGTICENLGISVEYLTFPFYWHELPVAYTDSLKKLAKEVPLTYHLAIRICFEGKKFFLDATWDSPLGKAKFPINKIGNKLINTKIAVVPCGKCIVHTNISKREEFIKTINASRGGKMSQEEVEFYTLLNAWLEHLRKI